MAGPGEFSLYARHLVAAVDPAEDPAAPRIRSNPNNPTGLLAGLGERAAVWVTPSYRSCVAACDKDADPKKQALRGDFIYEPEPEEILERLLPVYLETEVYRALLESAASFLAAQMTAMRNASKNANELIDTYTLQMNRARQAEITQEILEVVAGADALTA